MKEGGQRDTNWALSSDEFAERKSKLACDPVRLIISPTQRCNMQPRCVMCLTPDSARDTLMEKDMEALRPFLRTCKFLTLSADGEPLAAWGVVEALLDAVDSNCSIEIQTNGLMLKSPKVREKLIGRVASLYISIDAARKETYDKIRAKGKFGDLIYWIRQLWMEREQLRTSIPRFRLDFVAMKENLEEMEEFVRLASFVGAYGVKFTTLLAISRTHIRCREGFEFDYHRQYFPSDYSEYAERLARCRELCTELGLECVANE